MQTTFNSETELWLELYKLADALLELNPWKHFTSEQLITLRPYLDREPYYCSIDPSREVFKKIVIYPGLQSVTDFFRFLKTDSKFNSLFYPGNDRTCFTLGFAESSRIPLLQKIWQKHLGLEPDEQKLCPCFEASKKRYSPTLPDEEESHLLYLLYRQLLAVLKLYLNGDVHADYSAAKCISSSYDPEKEEWVTTEEALPAFSLELEPLPFTNDILKKKLMKQPQTAGDLMIDLAYANFSVVSIKPHPVPKPLMLFAVKPETNLPVTTVDISSDKTTEAAIFDFFTNYILENGRMKHVYARSLIVFSALENVCRECEILLSYDAMPAVNDLIKDWRNSLMEHFQKGMV